MTAVVNRSRLIHCHCHVLYTQMTRCGFIGTSWWIWILSLCISLFSLQKLHSDSMKCGLICPNSKSVTTLQLFCKFTCCSFEFKHKPYLVFFSCVARGTAMSVCLLVNHSGPDWNISTAIGWIAMTLCTDIHGPQRINLTDFGDPLNFHQHKIPLCPVLLCWFMVYTCFTLPCWHCHCVHVSMLTLVFSSKHCCVCVQPHRALSIAVDSWSRLYEVHCEVFTGVLCLHPPLHEIAWHVQA